MAKEFKDFILKGDLVGTATAFIIGVAFSALVTSLVTNIFTPLIAAIIGKPDFGDLTFTIGNGIFKYGLFLNALITFVSVAAVVFFFVIKPYNSFTDKFKQPEEDAPEADIVLLEEIRDLLKQQGAR